jgi:hypothetical protein
LKKQVVLNTVLLLIPLLIVVFVNEYSRFKSTNDHHIRKGITAINSNIKTPKKCSWYCHTDTGYCKKHHSNFLKQHTSKIDPLYFGIIGALHSAGDYGLANIIFLVILCPMLIYILLIRSIHMQRKINALKHK